MKKFSEFINEAANLGEVKVTMKKDGNSLDTGGKYKVIKALKGKISLEKISGFDTSMKTQTQDDEASIMPDKLDIKMKLNWKRNVSSTDLANAIQGGLSNKNYYLSIENNDAGNIVKFISIKK